MKKVLSVMLAASLALSLTACGANDPGYNGGVGAPSGPIYWEYDVNSDNLPMLDYTYEGIKENDFIDAESVPDSYFSLDRNTASYSYMRAQIKAGWQPAYDSVRIEEYINYFDYDYTRPDDDDALAVAGKLFDCPWNARNKLMTVSVAAEEIEQSDRAQNIVLLIDTSGSMYGKSRLGLIQEAFTLLVENLDEDDTVSIVTYASGKDVVLRGASGANKTEIVKALYGLKASGATYGEGGIELAYEIAQEYATDGSNNRVIIATDGDFNVGASTPEELEALIANKRDSGIYLSVLGVGMYNTNDVTMKTLAENGNGNYAYLDTVEEARKVLVNELNGTLNVVAKDAKIDVSFNSDTVDKYRLIGYESKMISQEDYEDDNADTGEIGSGHNVTAVYELILKPDAIGAIATAEVKYKDPQTDEIASVSYALNTADYISEPDEDCVFIGCVTEFGLILRNSQYKSDANITDILSRLSGLTCTENDPFKAEFASIVSLASELYN